MEANKDNINFQVSNLFIISLISGGLAGASVDLSLHPIDTIKTRLQSPNGFFKSGGFSKLYKGITPVIIGSAPTAALFFVTYESFKTVIQSRVSENYFPLIHIGAASVAEAVSCLIRVPVEAIKQRKQASILDTKFSYRLLYRGYWSTVLRDMPFSLIQFPVWEFLKKCIQDYYQREVLPFEGAVCGALAGGFSAALTTPLDVAKTRIMLAKRQASSTDLKVINVLLNVYKQSGVKGCFTGISLRVTWITLGGFIFFGVYDKSRSLLL